MTRTAVAAGRVDGTAHRLAAGERILSDWEHFMIEVRHQISAVRRMVGTRVLAAGEARVMTISQSYDAGMARNALISWVVHDQPWRLEQELIRRLDRP